MGEGGEGPVTYDDNEAEEPCSLLGVLLTLTVMLLPLLSWAAL